MTLQQILAQARESLSKSKIEFASLEAEVLLRHVLDMSCAQLYLELERKLSPQQERTFWKLVERRLSGEPSAYITGHREFYGLDFYVDQRVLIPRPESELLVEKAIDFARSRPISSIADIGTGCGSIAISLALNLPSAKIYATDISAPALEVARTNCERHGVAGRIVLLRGDLLEPLREPVDLVVANLPYVKQSEAMQDGLRFEPQVALDGGADGLEKVYRLVEQLSGKLNPQGCVLMEIGQGQAERVASLLENHFSGAQIKVARDLGGIERVVSLCLTRSPHNDKLARVLPEMKNK